MHLSTCSVYLLFHNSFIYSFSIWRERKGWGMGREGKRVGLERDGRGTGCERLFLVNWYFEPGQPQRITSGLKQTSVCLLFTHLLFTQVIKPQLPLLPQNQSWHNFTYNKKTKKNAQNIKHKIFKELVPSVLPLLKKHIRLGHAGIWTIPSIYQYQIFLKSIKNEWTKAKIKIYINA